MELNPKNEAVLLGLGSRGNERLSTTWPPFALWATLQMVEGLNSEALTLMLLPQLIAELRDRTLRLISELAN